MLFIALHPFWDFAFAQKVEPIFLQLHRVEKSFDPVLLRSTPRNRPPECEIQLSLRVKCETLVRRSSKNRTLTRSAGIYR